MLLDIINISKKIILFSAIIGALSLWIFFTLWILLDYPKMTIGGF